MGFYGPHVLLNDGQRHGVTVLPPDINASGADCTVEEGTGSREQGTGQVGEVGEGFITTGPFGSHPRDNLVFTPPKRAEMQTR
jgi:DNA polymerase III alpha subunit